MDHDAFMLPWDRDDLAKLVPALISRGEGPKVDMKRQMDLETAAQKGELLKDIQAMANTFDAAHQNHGFIVFGVDSGAIVPVAFAANEDHTQAQIDQLVKTYLGPFIQTKLFMFGEPGAQYAVLVIPPTRNAPHVFIREIERFKPGDIFVRRGSTTQKALPEDFSRFFRLHLEEHAYLQQVETRDLRSRLDRLESRPAAQTPAPAVSEAPAAASRAAAPPQQPESLRDAVEKALARASDPVVKGLVDSAARLRDFLRTDAVPWAPQSRTAEEGRDILGAIEDQSREYLQALARVVAQDSGGKFDDAVIKSIAILGEVPEVPPGTRYNNAGSGLRYLPLVAALHVAFVAGSTTGRSELLARLKDLELQPSDEYRDPEPVGEALFLVRQANAIFQTQHPGFPGQTWCEPFSEYMRSLVRAVTEGIDPQVKPETAFLQGELLVSLLPLAANPDGERHRRGLPAPGSFLYSDKARRVLPRFLRDNRPMLESIFGAGLKGILEEFDAQARRVVSSGCFGEGFTRGAAAAAYPTPE